MISSETHEVTRLLAEWAKGNSQALEELTPLVYQELRRLAASYLRRERQGNSLQPTALVHEAYLRLVDQSKPGFQNRAHFYGIAARLMRQILVDHARKKHAAKRAGQRIALEEAVSIVSQQQSPELIALDSALTDLEKIDPRKVKAIELLYFGGLSMQEAARALQISEKTVQRDLRLAEAWLHNAMQDR